MNCNSYGLQLCALNIFDFNIFLEQLIKHFSLLIFNFNLSFICRALCCVNDIDYLQFLKQAKITCWTIMLHVYMNMMDFLFYLKIKLWISAYLNDKLQLILDHFQLLCRYLIENCSISILDSWVLTFVFTLVKEPSQI